MQDEYHSPAATFLASSEFANHPDNPNPGVRITSNGNSERINHVSVDLISPDELEVFFYVRTDPGDRYDDIYRVVYDVSDPDFLNWSVKRDDNGQVLFDVVLTPEDITAAVQAANPGADPEFYADPVSLGDTAVFVDDDGSKYLFYSYVSDEFGGQQGEGQISAVRLNLNIPGDYNENGIVDAGDFVVWQDALGQNITLPNSDPNDVDGVVTNAEYGFWLTTFGNSREGSGASSAFAVPEPSGAHQLLLLCLWFGLIRRAKRRRG